MSYSLKDLLVWMDEKSRLLNWGAIFVVDRARINRLLIQEYIRRFNTESYFKPINQTVDLSSAESLRFVDYVLDFPRVSFENSDINRSKARLSMDVIAGGHLIMRKSGSTWMPRKLDWVSPLNNPRLLLDLSLAEVPGTVSGGGEVYLDLRNSDNFTLDISPIENVRRLAGSYFGEMFKRLPDAERKWPLGNIRAGADPILKAKSFKLRTQAKNAEARNPHSADYGDGAVLGFICLEDAFDGSLPETGSDFRYLLPNDAGKDYSATVLTDLPRVVLSQVCQSISEMVGGGSFRVTSVKEDPFTRAIAQAGAIKVPTFDEAYSVPVKISNLNAPTYTANGVYRCHDFYLDAKDKLRVQIEGDELTVTWDIRGSAKCTCLALALLNEDGKPVGDDHSAVIPNPLDADFSLDVVAKYRVDRARGEVKFETLTYSDPEMTYTDGGPSTGGAHPETSEDWWNLPWEELEPWQRLRLQFMVFPRIMLLAVVRAVARSPEVKPAIEAHLKKTFVFNGSINTFVDQSIKLNFGQAIQGDEVHIKHDVGFFGQVNPALTHFVLDPLEPRMAAGGTQQFSAVTAVANLEWTVEAVQAGVRTSSKPGVIDQKGKYTAPAASDVENGMTRVRVTATNSVSKYSSSALVTVLSDTLSIRPLVEILTSGEVLQLTGGTLNASDSLEWSIVNEPKHGSLVGSTYTAPTFPDPVQGQPKPPAYVVDVVEVRNTQSGAVRTAAIVTENNLSISINIIDLNLQQGRVELQALINGEITHDSEWTVLLDGPGSISADGVYVADPAREERFVLIESKEDGGKYGLWTGLILLPLPLADYAPTYDAMRHRV
ncbi:hypothetical protein CCOS865_04325 [Pseudomonas reidholzensis]|uniref:Uncharacterized protein n=1 Tax=Pseudomonas reidholzensis TaxID=1785162 RepID=A0A383RYS3_9PSED|nr:hypothetical protein [Pseudomonas reidholzensis]SYX92045.1 hypothetical protein CCOS865_04325 [Pseudomonas reidholzensis]